ncbi:hypothetical protein A9Q98_15950 [Thalassotalea sp. 42_200_T64]|nr:hypothetical protein A9Q98_15950 [Thalassotalea sp. 42_200_T64]
MSISVEEQQNNPLHGLKLEILLNELVDYYGWEILAVATNINCFQKNPSIDSSLKFLRKTDWAQEKLEAFYLYKFKHLPRPNDSQYDLPPRQRIIPLDQTPGEPMELTVELLQTLNERKAERAANFRGNSRGSSKPRSDRPQRSTSRADNKSKSSSSTDPWANFKSENE